MDEEKARQWTFALVDMAGFTALTESMGDEVAADLAISFAELAEQQFGPGDRLIKTLGDAVLLASDEPASALVLVTQILEACYQIDGFPIARAGLHHGPAVERGDDMFGAAINLTARVAAQATGGQALGTAVVAAAARVSNIDTLSLGTFELKNVSEPVEIWDLALCEQPAGGAVDPVCRMYVDRVRATGRLRHRDTEFWFCSLECAATFAVSPERFWVQ